MVVSVIMPMYNAADYVSEAIESVCAQGYTDWELVIVDDGSKDESPRIAREYAGRDSRIQYYRREANGGIADARNTGVSLAKGRYIAFLDSDDRWLPDKLERQMQFMEETGAHFCHSACAVINKDGERTGIVRAVVPKIGYRELLRGNVINCLTVLLDRKYIPDIRMDDLPHEDYAAWLRILKEGESAFGLNEVLAEYRENENSVSRNKGRAAHWTWNIYRYYLGLPLWKACGCFVCYAWNAVKKRIRL